MQQPSVYQSSSIENVYQILNARHSRPQSTPKKLISLYRIIALNSYIMVYYSCMCVWERVETDRQQAREDKTKQNKNSEEGSFLFIIISPFVKLEYRAKY